MKIKAMVAAVLAVFALSAIAIAKDTQNAAPKQGNTPRQANARMVKQLGLTDAQAKQIQDIVKSYHTQVRDIAKSNITKEQKKDKITSLRNDTSASIMALLTPEQKQKAEKMQLTKRLLSNRAGEGMAFGLNKLNLTDQQKAAIKGIMQESRDQAKAIKDDSSLNETAKKDKLTQLRAATKDKILAQLTAEQKQKLEEMRQKGQKRTAGGPKAGTK